MTLFKQISTLAIGNILAKLITVIGFVFLGRIYTPSEIGQYAILLALSSIVGKTASFRLELTILTSVTEKWATYAANICLGTLAAIVVLLFIFIAPFIYFVHDELIIYFFLTAGVAIGVSIVNVASYIQTRNNNYNRIVVVQILLGLGVISLSVILHTWKSNINGMILAAFIVHICASCILLVNDFQLNRGCGPRRCVKYAIAWVRRNKQFIQFSTPAVFVNTLSGSAPLLLLTTFFGEAAGGMYAMLNRAILAPVSLLSAAVNRVYMKTVTQKLANGNLILPFTIRIVKIMLLPSIIITFILFVMFEEKLLLYVFGEQWSGIDVYASVLLPMMMSGFVAKCVSGYSVLGKNKLGFIYQLILLASIIVVVTASYYVFSDYTMSLTLLALMMFSLYAVQVLSIIHISRNLDEKNSNV